MILALDVVLVLADELVFIRKFKEQREELQQLDDDFVMAFLEGGVSAHNSSELNSGFSKRLSYPGEALNLLDIILEYRRLLAFMVAIKFGDIIDLDVVLDTISEAFNSVMPGVSYICHLGLYIMQIKSS